MSNERQCPNDCGGGGIQASVPWCGLERLMQARYTLRHVTDDAAIGEVIAAIEALCHPLDLYDIEPMPTGRAPLHLLVGRHVPADRLRPILRPYFGSDQRWYVECGGVPGAWGYTSYPIDVAADGTVQVLPAPSSGTDQREQR